jgi:hypothetical protein
MNEKLLKNIVIFLGVLIVVALGGLIYGIVTKSAKLLSKDEEITQSSPLIKKGEVNNHSPYGAKSITIPKGANIVSEHIENDLLILKIKMSDGQYQWLVTHLKTGENIGNLSLKYE